MAAQLVLYALAPPSYPTAVRATGVGAAVAIGRLGSVAGPLAAGQSSPPVPAPLACCWRPHPALVIAALTIISVIARSSSTTEAPLNTAN